MSKRIVPFATTEPWLRDLTQINDEQDLRRIIDFVAEIRRVCSAVNNCPLKRIVSELAATGSADLAIKSLAASGEPQTSSSSSTKIVSSALAGGSKPPSLSRSLSPDALSSSASRIAASLHSTHALDAIRNQALKHRRDGPMCAQNSEDVPKVPGPSVLNVPPMRLLRSGQLVFSQPYTSTSSSTPSPGMLAVCAAASKKRTADTTVELPKRTKTEGKSYHDSNLEEFQFPDTCIESVDADQDRGPRRIKHVEQVAESSSSRPRDVDRASASGSERAGEGVEGHRRKACGGCLDGAFRAFPLPRWGVEVSPVAQQLSIVAGEGSDERSGECSVDGSSREGAEAQWTRDRVLISELREQNVRLREQNIRMRLEVSGLSGRQVELKNEIRSLELSYKAEVAKVNNMAVQNRELEVLLEKLHDADQRAKGTQDRIRDMLAERRCPTCFEADADHVLRDCGHCFCLGCLERLKSKVNHHHNGGDDADVAIIATMACVQCPICRTNAKKGWIKIVSIGINPNDL
eukprot:CAMPEP_0196651768 /NCGR_PEP_ID=MMETSP1086-20130531/859_1 /TAXON_ID=77921 /ORGANISM="Cyanoptyche  gloeocystis , Strain SAG4.97" /LENGTH=518 /DNA_ID=CAMNT_0041981945 /DNA_START=123 /DNA_END=1679 /DNA_ORIENTATION=+